MIIIHIFFSNSSLIEKILYYLPLHLNLILDNSIRWGFNKNMRISSRTKELKYKVPAMYYLILLILIVIAIWIIGTLSGLIPIEDILLNFIGFISMLVSITMLAIFGAIFLGMYLSHRILTKKGFTPFEISMMEMHEDIKEMKDRLSKLEEEINNRKNNGK